jgi:hypothetical protein
MPIRTPIVEGELKTLFPFAEDSHYRDLLSDLRHHPAFELNERHVRSVRRPQLRTPTGLMPLLCSRFSKALIPWRTLFLL